MKKQKEVASPTVLLPLLLSWYQHNKRDLPWRHHRDAYKIWLSEIMLQQTTVAAVIPFYEKFLAQWPTVKDLAAANIDEVLKHWAGLGYYSRARNLHKTANSVMQDWQGKFPVTAKDLKSLSGIGDYTAGAIAAIAHGEKSAAVDGNVVRVLSRLDAIATPVPQANKDIAARAQNLMDACPDGKEGDAVQALMELGATICTPRNPKCLLCPWQRYCCAFLQGNPEFYPVKVAKKDNLTRVIDVYWLENASGEVLLTRRPANWMLGGMLGFPSTALTKKESDHALSSAKIKWQISPDIVKHSFTHFDAELVVNVAKIKKNFVISSDDQWIAKDKVDTVGLPTLFAKVLKLCN